ncbi:MAG: DKNYY domain-containing protein [bacterium]|nr:DKNYY domain-containing protein [bacterium]
MKKKIFLSIAIVAAIIISGFLAYRSLFYFGDCPQTFIVLEPHHTNALSLEVLEITYRTIGNCVYLNRKLIKGADPSSFIATGSIAKDKRAVYRFGEKIEYADPKTFEIFDENESYGKDEKNVYFDKEKIEGADPTSFEPIGRDIDQARYDKEPTYQNAIMTGRGAAYGYDKNHVYYSGKLIPGSNGASFEYMGAGFAKDKNQHYCDGVVVSSPEDCPNFSEDPRKNPF